MRDILKLAFVCIVAILLTSCSGKTKKEKKKFHHSTKNYKIIERHPSSGEHAPIMENVLDQNLYQICRRERSEFYCKRRLGTWRQ